MYDSEKYIKINVKISFKNRKMKGAWDTSFYRKLTKTLDFYVN